MPSFDVVSRLDHQEIDNAIGNATREITTRYDFKGSDTSIEKKENSIIVTTDDEMKAGQVNDMLVTHFVRRKVDPLCLKKKDLEKAGTELAPISPEGEGNFFVPWKTGHWMIYPGKVWHRPGVVQSMEDRYIVAADMEF